MFINLSNYIIESTVKIVFYNYDQTDRFTETWDKNKEVYNCKFIVIFVVEYF